MLLLGACFVIVGALAVLIAYFIHGGEARLTAWPTLITGFALLAIGILISLTARSGPRGRQ
jgi:uncharacterized membrane protein HdeD (DUF308 family)